MHVFDVHVHCILYDLILFLPLSLYSVQVRRTDKINTEAAFHSIDEYMVHVEEWYEQLSLTQTVEQKRVFIATDEPTVIKEAKDK